MKKKEVLFILLILLCSIPSVLPLTHHGFFQTDDGEWMIIRLSAFYQALHDGQFPVRFLQRLNFNYGYPVGEFLYPGSFYLGSLLHIIRFGFVNTIKIIYGISLLGSAIFTYLWLKKYYSSFASFIGSLFAIYLPYHLYDVYKRGSVGEVFALLWVPFIFWQIERKSFFFTAVGIALLIISHNTLAVLFMPLIICYMLRNIFHAKNRLHAVSYYLLNLFCGIGLSSFFWIPAIFELHYTVFSSTIVSQISDYFASIYLIGYATLVVIISVLIIFTFKRALIKKNDLIILIGIFSILSLLFATQTSSLLWYILPAKFVQFPFRLLSIIIVTIPFLVAFIISVFKGKVQWITSIILLLLLAYSAFPYSKPVLYFDKGEGYYYTNDATTTVQDEYMPIWVHQKPLKSFNQKINFIKGSGKISRIVQNANIFSFSLTSITDSIVQVDIIYWPGWNVKIDNENVAFSYNNPQGVIQINIPKGSHKIDLQFGEDYLRLFADIISILFLITLIIVSKFCIILFKKPIINNAIK